MSRYIEVTINGENKLEDILDFGRSIGIDSAAPSRYSTLLLVQLYFNTIQSGTMNPAKVIHEINALEGVGRPSGTKPPQSFKKQPLKGLCYKHYLTNGINTMIRNLQIGLKNSGLPWLEERVREVEAAQEEKYLSAKDIGAIVNDAVHGNWIRRAEANELTGEWLIYAQHEGKNYYLCLGKHSSGDENIRKQIDDICCLEFPFLERLLSDASLEKT